MLLPGDPSRDILLIGGGGLLIFEEFMILSRPAVVFLANQVAADNPHGGDHSCKAELLTCSQSKSCVRTLRMWGKCEIH
jgi:hypothetical protein